MKKHLVVLLLANLLIVALFGSDVRVRAQESSPAARLVVPTPTPDIYVGAPPEFLYPGMLPDHPLYFLKDLYYRLRTKLVFGLSNQVNWYLKLADKRTAEARELAKRGKLELAAKASQKAVEMSTLAGQRFEQLGADKVTQEIIEKLKKANLREAVVLEGVLERVPAELKQTVGETLEKSRANFERVFQAVGEGKSLISQPEGELKVSAAKDRLGESLVVEIETNPKKVFKVQIRVSESLNQEARDRLDDLMDIQALTEKQVIGEAGGEAILKMADLNYVSRITLLPEATEEASP